MAVFRKYRLHSARLMGGHHTTDCIAAAYLVRVKRHGSLHAIVGRTDAVFVADDQPRMDQCRNVIVDPFVVPPNSCSGHNPEFGRFGNGAHMVAAYSPEARGRSERAFGTHQGRLPQELALAGITEMAAANRYLQSVYLPAFNAEFAVPAREDGSAFVSWIGGSLDDILCEQYERTVGNDNCVRFENLTLQIPADWHRCHYVKVRVRVCRYANGALALFHVPRGLAYFTPDHR